MSVSKTSRSSVNQIGNERGKIVVVADLDLLDADHVILINNRHDARARAAPRGVLRALR